MASLEEGEKREDVKSTAIVKYTAMESPAPYLELSTDVDLKKPPPSDHNDHWNGRLGHWLDPKMNPCFYSSIQMAHDFPDCIGEVDVISDAENIKTLLKIPFSNAHISMMVHRIGKTILLDEFDINSNLLRASKKEWEWLKKFFYEKVLEDLKEKEAVNIFGQKSSRGFLQNKNMLSNFFHYSLAPKKDGTTNTNNTFSENVVHGEHLEKVPPSFTSSPNKAFEKEKENHEFLRTVLWTFEDIRMLIGSDMPIFGAGVHPAVSLRLHDMQKPINVLTGLDYWLDNLMCNVPEVLMCYHLNGIVQKYELIKTEDIPQIKNSQFSATLVKDVAQNILSFLKAKATKSGHTYWLFKGKKDDIVKLYDLTALCSNEMDDREQNVFSFPVAMLLYRVAANMKDSSENHSKIITVHKLLTNCLTLLEASKHPRIATSAHYLLSDVYVPSTMSPHQVHTTSPLIEEPDFTDGEYDDEEDEDSESDPGDPVSSFNIKVLSIPGRCLESGIASDKSRTLGSTWHERCEASLHHVIEALTCIQKSREDFKKGRGKESFKVANPCQAIPLNYSPLKSSPNVDHPTCSKDLEKPAELSWQASQEIYLYKKATQLFCIFSEIATFEKQFSLALKYIKIGMLCIEKTQLLSESHSQSRDLLAYLLGLTGDIYFIAIQEKIVLNKESIYSYTPLEQRLVDIINFVNSDFVWCWEWPLELDARLNLSAQCYEKALDIIPIKEGEDYVKLQKRFGNINNELGVYYMNQALQAFNQDNNSKEAKGLVEKSHKHLEMGIKIFDAIGDIINLALLFSNTGRLLRLEAHILSTNDVKQVSSLERKLYDKAINTYKKAQIVLSTRKNHPQIWDSLNWEMSTTYYTLASLLQDYAPLEFQAIEEVEKEISMLFLKSLKLCEVEAGEEYKPLYQYRGANIHHKLASLYQYSYRNQTSDPRRAKQMKQLAEAHYMKSISSFEKLEHWNDLLKVTMEHMTLWSHQLAQKTGFSSKNKLLKDIFTTLIKAYRLPPKTAESSTEDSEEREKLLTLYVKQLTEFSEVMIKLYNSQSHKESQEKWKTINQKLKSLPRDNLEKSLNTINQNILEALCISS